MVPQDAKVETRSMPNDTFRYQKSEIGLLKWQESSIQKLAQISAEEFHKTKPKQRKPNKPVSHQTDQDLKS